MFFFNLIFIVIIIFVFKVNYPEYGFTGGFGLKNSPLA